MMATLNGCYPNWRNLISAPVSASGPSKPLRVKVVTSSWSVYFDASIGGVVQLGDNYYTKDDPVLLEKLEVEAYKTLSQAKAFEVVDAADGADLIVDAKFDIHINRSMQIVALRFFDSFFLGVPVLLGAPYDFVVYSANATFTLKSPRGEELGTHHAHEEGKHFFALYYGYGHLSKPFQRELGGLLQSLVEYVERKGQTLVGRGRGARR